jgi:hypothetical protein
MAPAKSRLEIASLARSHAPNVINMLIGIVNQEKSPPMARIAAGRELLDRGFGKAAQKVTLDDERPRTWNITYEIIDPRPDVDTIEQEPGRRLPNWDYKRYGDPDDPEWKGIPPEEAEIVDVDAKTDE